MSYCFAGNMHFMSWLFILKVYSVLNSIRWSCYLTLKVTPKKTDLVLYSWKRQRPIVEPTSLGVIVISCADRATYFGDLLEEKAKL